MKALRISDAQTMVFAMQDEIRRSEESRYDHRLHGVLLVAHGVNCRETCSVTPRARWKTGFIALRRMVWLDWMRESALAVLHV
jgi:hypothetical protein